jgi:hypothetical protein
MRLWKARVAWLKSSVRNTGVVQVTPPFDGGGASSTNYTVAGGGAWCMVARINRQPLGSIPFPDWHFKMPNFPSLKWLNIAALAKQVSTSKPARTG